MLFQEASGTERAKPQGIHEGRVAAEVDGDEDQTRMRTMRRERACDQASRSSLAQLVLLPPANELEQAAYIPRYGSSL